MIGDRIQGDPMQADWSQHNADIADYLGCSLPYVYFLRRKLNKPIDPIYKGANAKSRMIRDWLFANAEKISGLWPAQVKELCPYSASALRLSILCQKLGISIRRALALDVTKENLKQHVDVDKNGCWIWKFETIPSGYARVSNRTMHPIVYRWFNGAHKKGLHILHRCDVKRCVNPDHLYAGTPKQNAADCVRNGHHRTGRLLSDAQVIQMRSMHSGGMSISKISKIFKIEYGVARSAVMKTTYRNIRELNAA